jgi:hypothetical protein
MTRCRRLILQRRHELVLAPAEQISKLSGELWRNTPHAVAEAFQFRMRQTTLCSVCQDVVVDLVSQLGRQCHEVNSRSSVRLLECLCELASFLFVAFVLCFGVCLGAREPEGNVPHGYEFVQLFQ